MTDEQRAREFHHGRGAKDCGSMWPAGEVCPGCVALAAEFAKVRQEQHRATAEDLACRYNHLGINAESMALELEEIEDDDLAQWNRAAAAAYNLTRMTALEVRDAPPPEPAGE